MPQMMFSGFSNGYKCFYGKSVSGVIWELILYKLHGSNQVIPCCLFSGNTERGENKNKGNVLSKGGSRGNGRVKPKRVKNIPSNTKGMGPSLFIRTNYESNN
jgi:hypothetical protein